MFADWGPPCTACNGSADAHCYQCHGTGCFTPLKPLFEGACRECNGTARNIHKPYLPCPQCEGSGEAPGLRGWLRIKT